MNAFLFFRYAVFALFIVFSTIIASISAWNLGLLKDAGFFLQVDAFLIFLGVSGLLVALPILFIEYVRKGALVSRVWFEIAWVSVFWVMHLSGAAAFVAMAPSFVCGPKANIAFESICVSQNVLKTFTWLCSIMLLVYLLVLVVASALHMKDLPTIWKTGITEVSWFGVNERLGSSPPTPILARYRSGSTDSGRSGQSEKSSVLPLYLPASLPRLQTVPAPPRPEKLPAAPPLAHQRRQPTQYNPTSLYPNHMQKTLIDAGFLIPERKPVPVQNASSRSASPAQQSPVKGAPVGTVTRKVPPRERNRPPPLDLTLATRPLGTRVPARR